MATNILNYVKHGVAESSDLLASFGGSHLLNGIADVNIDNGSFCTVGDFVEGSGDAWKIEKPATTGELFLVLSSPLIYEDFTQQAQEESNFFNAANEPARLYQLKVRDKFALSKEAFADGAEPAVGKYLTFADYKAGVTDTKPESGHVLKIYDIATDGLYRVVVEAL